MKKCCNSPSRSGNFILKYLAGRNDRNAVIGDIEEEYNAKILSVGLLKAKIWYWHLVTISAFSFIIERFYWRFMMSGNYLKVAFRNLFKYKVFSIINIAGLASGMACCILIGLWILDEMSYDNFHENGDRIFRISEHHLYSDSDLISPITPAPLASYLSENFPDIVETARVFKLGSMLFNYENKRFYENSIILADKSFFQVFSYKYLRKDSENPLSSPNSIVINNSLAEKYFGDNEALGEILKVDGIELTVTGITEDIPLNTEIQFRAVISWSYLDKFSWYDSTEWGSSNNETYVMLDKNSDIFKVENSIRGVIEDHVQGSKSELSLQPIKDIHLYSLTRADTWGAILYVYIFAIIGILIMLIACINSINLTTIRAISRTREIGIRKVTGAYRKQIVSQFLGESLLLSFLSMILAIIISIAVLPVFNEITHKNYYPGNIGNAKVLTILFLVTLCTGLLSGSYPSAYLSALKPDKILRGVTSTGMKKPYLKRVLVIFQFGISIVLIISTLTVYNQVKFMLNKDIGWDKENLVCIRIRGDVRDSYEILKEELLKFKKIKGVTASLYDPAVFIGNTTGIYWDGKNTNENLSVGFNLVDSDFLKTINSDIISGRSFSSDFASDSTNYFIINESLAGYIGKNDVVGSKFTLWQNKGIIIGVVKDFHFQSMRSEIKPCVLLKNIDFLEYIIIRIDPYDNESALKLIRNKWSEILPDYPLDFHFVNESFKSIYQNEVDMSKILRYFTILAVFIACLGLFGLVSFIGERKKKEIAIRKVFGGSVSSIIRLISGEFIFLIVISSLISSPVAYILAAKWLEDFAYKVESGLTFFYLAGLFLLLIAGFTVSFQIVKSANSNPIDSISRE